MTTYRVTGNHCKLFINDLDALVALPVLVLYIGAIRSLANGKAVGPDGVSVELLFKITLYSPPCAGGCSILSPLFVFGGGARCRI